MRHPLTNWLETHWVVPSYSGWLLAGLAVFFFGAATNTMAGWLYVISGVMVALLAIAALLPERSLRGIQVSRPPIAPVSAGNVLLIELLLENQTQQTKTLIQVQDYLPSRLGRSVKTTIEQLPARTTYRWSYQLPAEQRGLYPYQTVDLRTATPLGLFWCRRRQSAMATAVVYPTVLPLKHCPIVDQIGLNANPQMLHPHQSQAATEGLTRTLRPYRWGDSTRLIHWRTSARYGELRVRELETFVGGQELVVCLDTAIDWEVEPFEQAVVAAASLYFYALHRNLKVSLWTANRGQVRGNLAVLGALAATQPGETPQGDRPPNQPVLWLSHTAERLQSLPPGSRWLLWNVQPGSAPPAMIPSSPGLLLQVDRPLQLQLQSAVLR